MEAAMRDKSLSHNTRRQYKSIATRFEDFSLEGSYWTGPAPDYKELVAAAAAWFEDLNLTAPATIATYRSAISQYASAAGYELRIAAVVEVPERTRGNTREVLSLTDAQLRTSRKEADESPAIRTALELAIAGLSIEQIAVVKREDVTAAPGKNIGMVSMIDGREIEMFDPVGVKWIMGEGAKVIPIGEDLAEATIRKRLAHLVYRTTRRHGGLRELRKTGVRRAIAIGISRRRIADSLDLTLDDRWGDFGRNASKRLESGYDPIPADPARGRAIAQMSEDEFDRLLDQIGDSP